MGYFRQVLDRKTGTHGNMWGVPVFSKAPDGNGWTWWHRHKNPPRTSDPARLNDPESIVGGARRIGLKSYPNRIKMPAGHNGQYSGNTGYHRY